MKIKKHHIVLASLVLALSSAVYLNWQLSDPVKSGDISSTGRELGAATYVNKGVSSTNDEMQVSATASVRQDSLSDEQSEFFASARAERQRTQDEMITLSRQILELSDSSDEAKEEAVEQLSNIEDIILSQNRIETTLKAKGFSDCLCNLSESSCTIIVPKSEIKENSMIIIKDCVEEVTDLPFENISIVEA